MIIFSKKQNDTYFFISFILLFFVSRLTAQTQDTTKIYLDEVHITASYPVSAGTAINQQLDAEKLAGINASEVSDAVKFLSGVQVKDYGGAGGLKTVSVRSLGAHHTVVAYDGIPFTDYQTGQTDLGRFTLGNVEMITLSTGINDDIFQTARLQSYGSALNIITRTPEFIPGKLFNLTAALKAGSFGLWNPSLIYEQKLNHTFSLQVTGEWLKSEGNYPFKLHSNNNQYTNEKRNNSDIETYKTDIFLSGKFKSGGQLSAKTYYYHSDRGLPGAAILHNNYSGERVKDENFFLQSKYNQPLTDKLEMQWNGKFNFSSIDYVNISNLFPGGRQENRYYQREYYLNGSFLYKHSSQLSFSWANDLSTGNFDTNFNNFDSPTRLVWQSSLATKYVRSSFTLTGNIISTYVKETSASGLKKENLNDFSPYVGLSVKPYSSLPLRIKLFYKSSYRLPTFGDLYFSRVPPINLKPENARQCNLGLNWVNAIGQSSGQLNFSADMYINNIRNRIVAIPASSLFIWSMQNYGKVRITGLDLNLSFAMKWNDFIHTEAGANCTFQKVVDRTDKNSGYYNKRMTYSPDYTGSGFWIITTPWLYLNYTLLFSDSRYYLRNYQPDYQLDGYSEHTVSLGKMLRFKRYVIDIHLQCSNIFDKHYETVQSYPMPGRSFQTSLKFQY